MITRKSIIDQHQGTHPDTGMLIYKFHEIVTEYDDLDEDDPDERAWVNEVHTARVALAQLSFERRAVAEEWLRNCSPSGRDDLVLYRRALDYAQDA